MKGDEILFVLTPDKTQRTLCNPQIGSVVFEGNLLSQQWKMFHEILVLLSRITHMEELLFTDHLVHGLHGTRFHQVFPFG